MTSSILPSALPITEFGFAKPADASSRIAAAKDSMAQVHDAL